MGPELTETMETALEAEERPAQHRLRAAGQTRSPRSERPLPFPVQVSEQQVR